MLLVLCLKMVQCGIPHKKMNYFSPFEPLFSVEPGREDHCWETMVRGGTKRNMSAFKRKSELN